MLPEPSTTRRRAGLTFRFAATRIPVVSAPRHRFLSLLLVAFWFLATQHCVLEAAELFSDHAAGCCSTQADGCEKDGCKAVEEGQYRTDAKTLKASAPDLAVVALLLSTRLLLVPPASDAPLLALKRRHVAPAWVPAWQFERRAAAPAHAPDSLIA